jgi:HK97 family phage major capsid protein
MSTKAYEEYARAREWDTTRERLADERGVIPSQISNSDVAKELAIKERLERDAQEARERVRNRANAPDTYGPGSPNSYFRDLVANAMAERDERLISDATFGNGSVSGMVVHGDSPIAGAGSLAQVRARLATVKPGTERRDVTSSTTGAGDFLGPNFVGDKINSAARAEASLAEALGLEPLPRGVKEVLIPRFATGANAAVQATEGTEVNETNIDGDTQAGKIAAVAGHIDLSIQALEWGGAELDAAIAQDLGKAIGTAVDGQLVSGSNASGQTLGLATVTSIKTVTWTDASATSQEFVAQCWKAYDTIANGGEGIADPDQYVTVMHPRRLAWAYHNPQGSQSIAPAVPGRIVASAGIRSLLGAGTNEDEVFVILPSELPVFASSPVIVVDEESLSGNMQVRVTAWRFLATGFGRAPAAICRISGTGLTAPVL